MNFTPLAPFLSCRFMIFFIRYFSFSHFLTIVHAVFGAFRTAAGAILKNVFKAVRDFVPNSKQRKYPLNDEDQFCGRRPISPPPSLWSLYHIFLLWRPLQRTPFLFYTNLQSDCRQNFQKGCTDFKENDCRQPCGWQRSLTMKSVSIFENCLLAG